MVEQPLRLEPNRAALSVPCWNRTRPRLTPGPEGYIITHLIPAQRLPRGFPGVFICTGPSVSSDTCPLGARTQPCAPFSPCQFDPLVAIVTAGKRWWSNPPAGTQVSCFERSLLEPNSARTDTGTGGEQCGISRMLTQGYNILIFVFCFP